MVEVDEQHAERPAVALELGQAAIEGRQGGAPIADPRQLVEQDQPLELFLALFEASWASGRRTPLSAPMISP